MPPIAEQFNICRVCNGDPRASAGCKACRGAGVSAASPEGDLVWIAPVDDFSFKFKKARRQLNAVVHLLLALVVIAGLGACIISIFRLDNRAELATLNFWLAGYWYVTLLWLGLFVLCFLIFRLRVYLDEVKSLPNWGRLLRDEKPDAKQTVDVAAYFQPAAWAVVERAYELAKKLGRAEVQPIHLFIGALASPAGGIFLTRLAVDLSKIKEGLAVLARNGTASQPTQLSLAAKEVLLNAFLDAYANKRRYVGTIEVFLQAFFADPDVQRVMDIAGFPPTHVKHVAEWVRIQEQLKEEHDRFVMLAAFKPKTGMNRAMTAQRTVLLDQLSEDMTLLARNGYLAPIIGREREVNEIFRAIESGRRGVALVGDAGSGKSALVEALARRMVEEDVPAELFDKRLVSVNLPQLLASSDPGLAAERFLRLLNEAAISGNVVLVLNGIEALAGSGLGGTMDLAETLASELDRGGLLVMATTTPQAWTAYLERRSLGAKLVKVNVAELDKENAIRVLMAKSGYVEYQNRVYFSYAALEKAVDLAGRYMREVRLPESALNVVQEAAVLARKERGEQAFVLAEDVARVIHDKTNIPVEAVGKDESEKLLQLEARLHQRVIGQEDAVKAVSQAMRRARAGVREGKRPIANFLFMGPTGVGKTELAKALAAEYFGSEQAMIRLDMSEYQDQSAVTRVIGAPGDERGGLLTEAVRKNPFAIVLLDELEKAHPDILTLFLQVMDDGRLTDGVGRTIDFTNVVLIATSNAGTQFIQDQVKAGTPLPQIKTALLERELKGIFRPEFLNRFDAVIVFKLLSLDDVTQIAWLMINSITKRMEEQGMTFKAEDAAVEELAKAGYDPLFGARPLRRVIQEQVDNALADLLLKKEVNRGDTITLLPGNQLKIDKASLI